ncbi:hypothetical protein QL285_064185 [Trifolium repens]|nr:hypothetical protein QL285_064185 [Trifolium repens]
MEVPPEGEVLVQPSLFGPSTTRFDLTTWVHDQSVRVSFYSHSWARIGSSVGVHFVMVLVAADVGASPMVVVSEALGRPVAESMKGCLSSLTRFG